MKPRTYLTAAIAIVALGSFPFFAQAQQTAEGKKSDEILGKIHKLDMINQILPVLMTTTQIKTILGPLEQARQAEKALMSKEAVELRKLEAKADQAIKEALEKRKVVPQETMKDCAIVTKALGIGRDMFAKEHIDKVTAVVESTLDAGQRKAAAGSVNMAVYFPGKTIEEVPESTRLRTWVKFVLMDRQSYDLLVELSRRTSD